MKYLSAPRAQGDIAYIKIDALPEGLESVIPENAEYVVAHSETGHNHVIEASPNVKLYQDPSDALTAYLEVIATDVQLTHKRSFDTHAPHVIAPGIYQMRRQREYMPEGFRRAAD